MGRYVSQQTEEATQCHELMHLLVVQEGDMIARDLSFALTLHMWDHGSGKSFILKKQPKYGAINDGGSSHIAMEGDKISMNDRQQGIINSASTPRTRPTTSTLPATGQSSHPTTPTALKSHTQTSLPPSGLSIHNSRAYIATTSTNRRSALNGRRLSCNNMQIPFRSQVMCIRHAST